MSTTDGGSHALAGTRGRVLIVEEDRLLLDRYADLLLARGYSVSAARSSSSAARLLDAQGSSFDAVVTEGTFAEEADVLRAARGCRPGVPVVCVTGTPGDEAEQAREMGALHCLVKPFAEGDLLRCVDDATEVRRRASEPHDAERHAGASLATAGREDLDERLTRAIESAYMTYQPILRSRDRSVFGWEALLRTKEPAVAGPLEFLDLAERLDRTQEVGRAVRRAVARVAARIRGVVFFVNLHPDDLLDGDLFDAGSSLAPRAPEIVLEITERRPIEEIPDIRDRLSRLRAIGYRIAIDDLGAGCSSLASIAALDPDFVKLDRGLVAGVDHDPGKAGFVAPIVRACRGLGMTVVAEGVETEAEQRALVAMGCDLVQGYLFRRPEELRGEEYFPLAAER